jgi:uncharacterized secreted protein with C-terminal beta-propeller domain
MEQLLERQLEQALTALENGTCWLLSGDRADGITAGGNAGVVNDSASPGPESVSETNNQVAGVDEADFIKNDDRYIYVIAKGALQILEAWPASSTHVIARVALEDEPKRLLVQGDRLLVVSSVAKTQADTSAYQNWWNQRGGECTYGYDCDFTGDGNATRLSIFDISDRAAPKLLRTIETSATFLSARRIDHAVHAVVYQEPEFLRTLPIVPPEFDGKTLCSAVTIAGTPPNTYERASPAPVDPERVTAAFEALRSANRAAIEAAPVESLFEGFSDSASRDTSELGDCSGYYDSPLSDGTAFLSLLSLDLQAETPLVQSTIVSRPGASYASKDAYYLSVRQNPQPHFWFDGFDGVDEASTVHKFALTGTSNRYAASGVVSGRVLNQFSMDEHDGNLRIATTIGHVPSPDVKSALSVLRQEGRTLLTLGMIDGIAPTEDIRSVRFVGDKGYIVTFKKTDPLFVLDLSEPTAPRIEAELKIPGFSTYMHPFADGHLLTIGYDAADQSDFAYFTGLMLQVFDVRDAKNPTLTSKVVIGTRGSSSEAATNHLAFNYFAPRDTLAIPITVCEGGNTGGQFGSTMTFSGVQLYHVTPDTGFSLTGEISHPYADPTGSTEYAIGGQCSNWWTRSNSVVQRTIFMDDFVYSVSDERIKVNDLRAPSTDLVDIAF